MPELSGVELPKPQRKILSSLGHHIMRLAAACERLAQKSPFPELAPWLDLDPAGRATSLTGDGIFACPLILNDTGLRLHQLVAPAEQCLAALPTTGSDQGGLLAIPASLNDPLWLALLRLRPLRDFWERELRRSTVDVLLGLLPDAWLLDPTPLPPGSVIPRLDLASWGGIETASGRFSPANSVEIAAKLASYPGDPGVLTSVPEPGPDDVSLLSIYRKSGDRVDWIGVARTS